MRNKIQIITFSGVDGAGKTTILREFTTLLEEKYNQKVVELRHRPSVLPILSAMKHGKKKAELKTLDVLPRTGTNESKISSFLRFSYYLTDYMLGQWVIYFRYTRKGYIVIYDRYYFDFINDPKRTNINLSKEFISKFYSVVFKPEINIFLFAPPEVILARKQEMDSKSIVELTKKYKDLFIYFEGKKKGIYCLIENIDKEATLKLIESLYLKGRL